MDSHFILAGQEPAANPAQKMKRLVLLTLILGLLSCSASRKVSSSIKTDITDKTEANVTQKRDKDSSGRTESHVTEDSSGTKDKEVVIEKFDTDKPTDPVTGTPPLKRETTQTRRKTDAGRQTQTTGQTIDEHRELSGESSSREAAKTELQTTSGESTHTDTNTETHERRGLNPLQRLLCTLGGIAVAAGVVWLVWKLKRHL
mgnify:CR=1 FL=1